MNFLSFFLLLSFSSLVCSTPLHFLDIGTYGSCPRLPEEQIVQYDSNVCPTISVMKIFGTPLALPSQRIAHRQKPFFLGVNEYLSTDGNKTTENRQTLRTNYESIIDGMMIIIKKDEIFNTRNSSYGITIFHSIWQFEERTWYILILAATLVIFSMVSISFLINAVHNISTDLRSFFTSLNEGQSQAQERDFLTSKYIPILAFLGVGLLSFVGFVSFNAKGAENFSLLKKTFGLSRYFNQFIADSFFDVRSLEFTGFSLQKERDGVTNETSNSKLHPSLEIPWMRDVTNCSFQILKTYSSRSRAPKDISLAVNFGVIGEYLIGKHSYCDKLEVYKTKEDYVLNGVWLYSPRVNNKIRKQIDRDITQHRNQGTLQKLLLLDDEPACNTGTESIGLLIILVPVGIFVFPPLLCSVLVILFGRQRNMTTMTGRMERA